MYCKHCGKIIANDSYYCCYCGTNLVIKETGSSENDVSNESVSEIASKLNADISDVSPCGIPIKEPTDKTDIFSQSPNSDSNIEELQNKKTSLAKLVDIIGVIFMFIFLGTIIFGGILLFLIPTYCVIMTNLPNGKGILIFSIILGITVYFLVKLIYFIIKSYRK